MDAFVFLFSPTWPCGSVASDALRAMRHSVRLRAVLYDRPCAPATTSFAYCGREVRVCMGGMILAGIYTACWFSRGSVSAECKAGQLCGGSIRRAEARADAARTQGRRHAAAARGAVVCDQGEAVGPAGQEAVSQPVRIAMLQACASYTMQRAAVWQCAVLPVL